MSHTDSDEAIPTTKPLAISPLLFHEDQFNPHPLLSGSRDRPKFLDKWQKKGLYLEKDEDDDFWMVATSCSSASSTSNVTCDIEDENDCESDVESSFINFDAKPSWTDETINFLEFDTELPTTIESKFRRHLDLSRVKEWLAFYSNFVYKTGNQDILLKLMQWSLWLVGAFTPLFLHDQEFSEIPKWITKLSYDICYARYVTRLLGLPTAIEGALSGSWASSSYTNNAMYDYCYRVIGNILAYSMIFYYPVEHVAFFLWMNPNAETILHMPADVWFYMSMRCWLVYIVAESFQCMLKYLELSRYKVFSLRLKKNDHERSRQRPKTNDKIQDNDSNSDVAPKELDKETNNVVLLLVRNSFFILPCIHWSKSTWDTSPWLPDVILNGLMWSEAVLSLYQAIYNS